MIDKKQSSENRRILRIAIPSIISNITVPLLGLIDFTIVGHLGSPAYIGAIAVGGMLFNIIYWIFGFLRMGTSGMTSQAYGQHDLNEITRLLLRSVGVGLFIALCLLILQYLSWNWHSLWYKPHRKSSSWQPLISISVSGELPPH